MSAAATAPRTGSARTILLRGNYAEGNFGDDALAIAAQRLLAPHAVQIATDVELAYRDRRLDGLRRRGAHEERFDTIVYGGGTQFFSFKHDPPAALAPLAQRVLRKLTRPLSLIDSYRARRRHWIEFRTPRLGIGIGVGPFPVGSPAEAAAASLLKGMALVWVRDDASMAFCERHGVETALRSADLCFSSAFAEATHKLPSAPERTDGRKQVGVILRDWKAWDDAYFEAAIEAARRLRDQGVEPTFFSLASSDTRFLAALSRSGEPVTAWRCEAGAFETFWHALAQMDLVVTARFHGAVFAVLGETPFLAIGIEPKLELVRDWAPASEAPEVTMPATTDPELIARRVLAALGEIEHRREAARAMLREQRRLAASGEQRLAAYFDGGRARP
ncbi:polysaccharide pyruvyl transferase family protein [Hyphomicrobium zavarzinii]|uniref:polysaccharide pyruvyl transferase family protein n=1 Tax=Hyphomicrobium zavarzinii TaxID=48292 RepID=UPI0003653A13|nr:polysaccharide pyruvyl transferase family protein [Hyphomicrobium zavarzinii]